MQQTFKVRGLDSKGRQVSPLCHLLGNRNLRSDGSPEAVDIEKDDVEIVGGGLPEMDCQRWT